MAILTLTDTTRALAWRVAKIALAVVLFLFLWWAISQLLKPSVKQQAETAKDTVVAVQQSANATAEVEDQAARGRATVAAVTERTTRNVAQARAAPSGRTPLPADVAARVRDGDEFLCQSRPPLCEGRGGVGPAED